MSANIFLSLKNKNIKEYTDLLGASEKEEINKYLMNEITSLDNFTIKSILTCKNEDSFLLEEETNKIIKPDKIRILNSLMNNSIRIGEFLGDFLILNYSEKYLFFKKVNANLTISHKPNWWFGEDNIKLLPKESLCFPLDWDFCYYDSKLFIKNYKSISSWLIQDPQKIKKDNFDKFTQKLINFKINLPEGITEKSINNYRNKDIETIINSNLAIDLDYLKKMKFLDKKNTLYKTKINPAIACMVDKFYISKDDQNIGYMVNDYTKTILKI